ncbi:zf-CCHC domain-containing protein [Tanacetum coccineum]
MESNFNNENDLSEFSLGIDDSDFHLTPLLRSSSSTRVEPSPSTPNPVRIIPVRIIPGPAGIVQQAKLLKERDILLGWDEAVMSTQEYMQKVVEDVDEDDDFKSGSWISATEYVNANGSIVSGCLGDIDNNLKKGKLDQVVAIVKSCSPNVLGDLTMTMKDLSGTIPGTIHYKVIGEGVYGNDITVGAAMILANVSVFSPKPSMHYLNITKRNVVKVFRNDTVPESVEEHDTCDEYLTEGFLTEKEQQQLAQDEEAYRQYLEEETKAEKERARAGKE